MEFSDLKLKKQLQNALEENGYSTPTTIQQNAFSPIMSGRDVVGLAQTGTGKTLAYLLPVINLWKFTKSPYPQILIIVPTRELVVQVVEQIEMLTERMNLVVGGAYGGANIKRQISMLELGLDVLVATPGRLYDLLLKGALKANTIKKLVIDEVDEMLNLGFRTQLRNILNMLPEKRQTLLFSATMEDEIEYLIQEYFKGPLKIEAAPMGTPLENIQQSLFHIPNFYSKVSLLKVLLDQDEIFSKVLVFTATKKLADQLAEEIEDHFGEQFGVIHSNKSQNFRFNVIKNFKDGSYRFIIATDIVARGIDVSEVSHVINFDTPEVAANYIHRIGRTGRADKKGNSLTFVTEKDKEHISNIESLMNYTIPESELPDGVIISEVLTEDEMPKVNMKTIKLKDTVKKSAGEAFHEKKAKNKKTNLSRSERAKMRTIKNAMKRKSKKKGRR
ncbi:MAG: DEAD/DEAH box helicase [Saprospiraceae bacterium]|nr:DEAD/DEAH box helicase [Saprospiraceae bacterium]